jgi:hypothetical protein
MNVVYGVRWERGDDRRGPLLALRLLGAPDAVAVPQPAGAA